MARSPRKHCSRCGRKRTLDQFSKNASTRSGYQHWCKECGSDAMSTRRAREDWPVQMLYNTAKARAKERGAPFEIATSDITIPEHCPILGIPLKRGDGKAHDNSPTLDAIVPSLGYVPGNVAVISYRANRAKGPLALQEIIALAEWCAIHMGDDDA